MLKTGIYFISIHNLLDSYRVLKLDFHQVTGMIVQCIIHCLPTVDNTNLVSGHQVRYTLVWRCPQDKKSPSK